MSILGWIVIVLVILVLGLVTYLLLGAQDNRAVGYTREHGYCPNMGVCEGCDLCEEDK